VLHTLPLKEKEAGHKSLRYLHLNHADDPKAQMIVAAKRAVNRSLAGAQRARALCRPADYASLSTDGGVERVQLM
jgi:hypothetical protein